MIHPSSGILRCIGRTPLLTQAISAKEPSSAAEGAGPAAPALSAAEGAGYSIHCKLEFMNPSGSVKDRIAGFMLERAEERGELKPGMRIMEVTSGNTGIALAMAAAAKGYALTVLMPETMTSERVQILRALGAEVCLTPVEEGFLGALERLRALGDGKPGIYLPRQFENQDNVRAHYLTTAPEIWEQTGGNVDAFVDGVGTGGTLMGVGQFLRERNPACELVAVEPLESAVMSGSGTLGEHKIAGIGDGFIPPIVDMGKVSRIEAVSSDDAVAMTRRLGREFGLMVGISSGANVIAALRTAARLGRHRTVVTILPDRAERYFSSDLYRTGEHAPVRQCSKDCECVFA